MLKSEYNYIRNDFVNLLSDITATLDREMELDGLNKDYLDKLYFEVRKLYIDFINKDLDIE